MGAGATAPLNPSSQHIWPGRTEETVWKAQRRLSGNEVEPGLGETNWSLAALFPTLPTGP